jgi:hypothetical protein
MASKIFISYRRGDDPGNTGRLFDRLQEAFPREHLFIDVDSIAPGLDFVRLLEEEVAKCDVLLAVIGKRWLDERDSTGARRLDNPEDFVRIEVESALNQGKRVIPVLVGEAAMPRPDDLPQAIKLLARRNAVRLTHERFRSDTNGLIKALQEGTSQATEIPRTESEELPRNNNTAAVPVSETSDRKPWMRARWQLLLIVGLAIVGGLVAALLWTRGIRPAPTSVGVKETSSFTTFGSIPLQPGAKVLADEVISVTAHKASGSNLFVPRSGTLQVDYDVDSGKEMMITLINGEQYQQLSSGQKPSGEPVLKELVGGIGSRSVSLESGNYFLAFNNQQATNTRFHYRTSFVEPFDSIKLDPHAVILDQATIVVPTPATGVPFGPVGIDITAPARGWLGIDFSLSEPKEITLLIVRASQKDRVLAGLEPLGDVLARVLLKGPEMANHEVAVVSGEPYFVAFLNYGTAPAKIIYRTSIRTY